MTGGDFTWRTENVGALLFAATDRCVRRKLQVLHTRGYHAISDAQLALFIQLDADGARLTTLAGRAGLTKQSMIELVDKAESAGFVARAPDPADKRAKVVRFTTAGLGALDALHAGIVAAEQEVAEAVGPVLLQRMKRELGGYAGTPGAPAWRSANIGRLLALSARRFAGEALGVVHRHGHRDVGDVLLTVFRVLDLDGTRLTDLAARARMTKQSMRELVDRAEALGLVTRRQDPHDRRAKVIAFTGTGLALMEQVRIGIAEAEAQFAAACAPGFVADLKAGLSAYCAAPAATDLAA